MSPSVVAAVVEPMVAASPVSPFRWLAIPITATLTGNGIRIPRGVLPEIASVLEGRPVRWSLRDGRLDHPRRGADADDPAIRVGMIERAWATPWAVQAVIALDPDAARLHSALLRMRAAGQLRRLLGLSLHFEAEWAPGPALVVARIVLIRAVDFVAAPADTHARVLRPLRPEEFTLPIPRPGGDT